MSKTHEEEKNSCSTNKSFRKWFRFLWWCI